MKIVGLMPVRNEKWVLGLSLRAALMWVDEMVVLDHGSHDSTAAIIRQCSQEYGERIHALKAPWAPEWNEMPQRQRMLDAARANGATHIALIDADEVLTGNLVSFVRAPISLLAPGEVLDLKMIPTWRTLEVYRQDHSVWSRSRISLAFRDKPDMAWKPRADGYQHHRRVPTGETSRRRWDASGGVFHLQFANRRRLVMKHVWYRMMERIRWPERHESRPELLNAKYDEALDETDLKTKRVPETWWRPYRQWLGLVDLHDEGWYRGECLRLIAKHGRAAFAGLNLHGAFS